MLAHRRQYRPLDTNNNIIVEATSETALQDKTTPDETPLPLSQATSPIKNVASNVYARPMSRDSQQESSPNHDREKCTQERVVIQEEAGDHEAIAHEVTPAGKNSVEALDPIAEGQKKLAEFWPIYVKEADSFDRELSEGWNNMLEVILIFVR
ncbi:hypothetical protein BDV93DRAFT_235881 [Ceratobasidium sp. AG-I]|nr:hypothetical protein BDV93DRAFT_235881 [Ceratobasidium sp. AG-I]